MTDALVAGSRTRASYAALRWDEDERPSWWSGDLALWQFTDEEGAAGFATADLEVALDHLQRNRSAFQTDAGREKLRQMLFLEVPLNPAPPHPLEQIGYSVVLWHAPHFLRQQVERMDHLAAMLKEVTEETQAETLRVAEVLRVAHPDQAHRLFEPTDSYFFMGTTPRRMRQWAGDQAYFHLQQFCQQFVDESQAKVAVEKKQRSDAYDVRKQDRDRERRFSERMNMLKIYFSYDNYQPRSPEEAEAMRLHGQIAKATTAAEEDAARHARDAYIMQYIVDAESP